MKQMRSLSPPDVESELSYAYLHAVASKAGMSCRCGNRHEDNSGTDAVVTAWLPYVGPSTLTEVTINVQLKATVEVPSDDGAKLSYFLREPKRYDDLRRETVAVPRILVVLFLPAKDSEWLHHSPEQLALRRCAYWESLRGAPEITTTSGTTVKLPKAHIFSPDGLSQLAERLSRRDFPRYGAA